MDADQQLMARVRDGDREAFEALYLRFGSPVMRFLYRLCGDRVLAEDLTQDVFLKVWRAAAGWRPLGKVGTWLFQIAKHHWWNEAAKRRRRAAIQGSPWTAQAAADARDERATPPTERVTRVEWARAVEAALAALSPKLRLVFVLVRLEGVSYAETAEIAGIPVGTVKSRAAAAEAALRKRLRREDPSP
ncbi:MAG: RNA polymerase sigma factor [Planctomycetota bacterium]|nr:RNA polymerase sigma factor [Planctomycetota bacterium]